MFPPFNYSYPHEETRHLLVTDFCRAGKGRGLEMCGAIICPSTSLRLQVVIPTDPPA